MKLIGSIIKGIVWFDIFWSLCTGVYAVTPFDSAASITKKSIVTSIERYPTNVSFSVIYSLPIHFDRCEKIFPSAWRFGLVAVESSIDSRWADGLLFPVRERDLLFLYESNRHASIDINHWPSEYCGAYEFELGSCRIVFSTWRGAPDKKRYISRELIPCGELDVPFEQFWKSKGIDKAMHLRAFQERAFAMCDGGAYELDFESAMRVVRAVRSSRADSGNISDPDKKAWKSQSYGNDVELNSREISEIVYWLWKRDGKVGKYPELCKRHPELFEPISGLDDFKTEIGRMLVERSKQ